MKLVPVKSLHRYSHPAIVTATHCSYLWGTLDSTQYHQPVYANSIGFETLDYHWWECGTYGDPPQPLHCVYADANVVDVPVRETGTNEIARTSSGVDIDQANPAYYVLGEDSASYAGETVHMIGRTTGHTSGTIKKTCQDYKTFLTNHVVLCNDASDMDGQAGDSGAPVFKIDSSDGSIWMSGIYRGNYDPHVCWGICFYRVFSPMAQVHLAYPSLTRLVQ